ncbi:MAG: 3-keto-5-aminohexanoate cleavage protein [Syntrophales bacterium]|nr:3-keto-5-aminohexanoate cleavage protein [Syntrophales bacterium]MDD5531816.1 3-keto-5-aminohexanoate cleavage protein [Syntrophales bacterium]
MKYSDYVWDYKDVVQFEERIKNGTMPPLIISVAITGGVIGKEANPNLPESPEEQADEAYACYKAGASAVHIHARDPQKGFAVTSSRTEHFFNINRMVRERCPDIIINNTTGGGFDMTREERMASLSANPEVCSLNCGPIILKATLPARKPPLSGRDEAVALDDRIIIVTFRETELFSQAMMERNIKPELEIYNPQQLNVVHNLIRQKLLKKPYWYSVIFSTYLGGLAVPGNLKNYINMIDNLPADSMFQTIGVGLNQVPMMTLSILTGGHVRVGMEDNLFHRRGELLKSNAQAVEKAVRLAGELGREVATPEQARQMLGIPEIPSRY